ncbi:MAG: NAD(P)-dependent alcohol dehydrogenase [Oceanobacter sp.]
MRAAIFDQYGAPEVVHLEDIAKPFVGAGEIRVKTIASTVSAGDWRIRSLSVPAGFGPLLRLAFGIFKPRIQILGSELVGEVCDVGEGVTRFQPGDLVVGYPGASLRCHAEYRVFKESDTLIRKPERLTMEEAAAMSFGGITAYDFLVNKGKLKAGEKVLIIGASGSVGSSAVQIAKNLGAEVTAVCSSANETLVRELGAEQVLAYDQQDPMACGQQFDLVLDCIGQHPLKALRGVMAPEGRALLVVVGLCSHISAPLYSQLVSQTFSAGVSSEAQKDLEALAQLVEAGAYRPLVDRVMPLSEIVEAHRYVDTGRKRGSLVIRM